MRSNEELFFTYYLDELKEQGFVSEYWYEPKSFLLSERVVGEVKGKKRTIFQEHSYTPDFYIEFNKVPSFLEGAKIVNGKWWVDVKGSFNRHGGDRVFPINAKWLYQRHNILVEKIIPQKLFEKTFTPEKFLLTEKKKQERKIKWQVTTIRQLINSHE